MPLLTTIVDAAQPWADLYANSKPLETGVLFAHFAGLLVGGGFALATDRLVFRSRRTPASDTTTLHRVLTELHAVHRPVLIGLGVTIVTGVLLFAADVETLATMATFWVKMGLIALLLANGWAMRNTEGRLRAVTGAQGAPGATDSTTFARSTALLRRLRVGAGMSFALWLAVTLAGVCLTNA
jgi:hypothetical protein